VVDNLDEIIDHFERQCEKGEFPDISILVGNAEQNDKRGLFAELLKIEIFYRQRLGKPKTKSEIQSQFPDFVDLIESIFLDCDLDNSNEIHQNQSARTFSADDPSSESPRSIDDFKSRRIGNYKLLQEIGRGGMGSVWLAEQIEPIKRKVALKLIRPGLGSKEVIARFEAERQALAMMDHENIARVFDAGTASDGSPYFVMELVKGVSLVEYCDQNKLNVRERLELFVPVCKAVQHAHQKGVIHRDLKPSNILVTFTDGKPVPKVIDFGLAKSFEHTASLTEKTMFTEFGKVIGTLRYMSPEQAELNSLDVDIRTDIYSLGVVLYELLTGSTPLDEQAIGKHALVQVLHLIREKDPPIPSLRLSSSGDAIAGISEQRRIGTAKLFQILRGDLDWVVMKAIEKDRSRRYDAASDIAEDIQRYLNGDAIEARPPTAAYKFSKFVNKNRGLVAASTLIIASLVAGIIGTSIGLYKNGQALELADQIAGQQTEFARKSAWSEYAAKINLAQTEWNHGDANIAWDALSSCQWDLRGWEHDYLYTKFTRNQLNLIGHTGYVSSVAFSPDRTLIVSGSSDKTIKVWSAISGEETLTLKGHTDRVSCVAFSPGGTQIVSGSHDNTIKLWSAISGEETRTLKRHLGPVTSVAFSPDGTQIVSGSSDKTIKVWSAISGEETRTLTGHTGYISSVAFSPTGTQIVSGSGDNTIKVWNAISGEETRTLKGHQGGASPYDHAGGVSSVAFSPDGTQIVSGSWDRTIKVWNAFRGEETRTLKGHTGDISSVAFSPDGTQIISGSYDKTIKVWNAISGEETNTLKGHQGGVFSVAISPDGTQIVSGSLDKTIKVWNANGGEETLTLKGHAGGVGSVAFSSGGTQIASGSYDKTIKVWSPISGERIHTLKGHHGPVKSVAFSPDGTQIVSGSSDKTIKVWNAISGEQTLTLKGHAGDVSSVAFSPDGTQIVSGSYDNTIKVWNATSGKETLTLTGHAGDVSSYENTGGVNSVAFSPDGSQIVSGSYDNTIKVWNAIDGEETRTLKGHTDYVFSAAFSPDGMKIVSGSGDNTIKVWNAVNGEETLTLKGHTDYVFSVAFSPDGTQIVSGGDNTIRLWNAASGEETLTLKGHTWSVVSVAFSHDGTQIVSGSGDITVKLWNATSSQEIHMLNGHDNPIKGVSLLLDETQIVSGRGDNTIKVWNAISGESTHTLKKHSRGIMSSRGVTFPSSDADGVERSKSSRYSKIENIKSTIALQLNQRKHERAEPLKRNANSNGLEEYQLELSRIENAIAEPHTPTCECICLTMTSQHLPRKTESRQAELAVNCAYKEAK
jgi:WD40 repeat protein/serine/threonine protein kinase